MPIITNTDMKAFSGKRIIAAIYFILILGGIGMVYPFMVTINASTGTHFDYQRREALPRFLWSREDRLMRTICCYFPPKLRNSIIELRGYFPSFPEEWQLWSQIGDDMKASDAWARKQLDDINDPVRLAYYRNMAADYGEFMSKWNIEECVLAFDFRYVAPFLMSQYHGDIRRLNVSWKIGANSFSEVNTDDWYTVPIDHQGYIYSQEIDYRELVKFREAYRQNKYSAFLSSVPESAGYLRPASLAHVWENYASEALGIREKAALSALPFPVPENAPPEILKAWKSFLKERFPLRHFKIQISPELKTAFASFLSNRFHNLEYLNKLLRASDPNANQYSDWGEIILTESVPEGELPGKIWIDFVNTAVPVDKLQIRDSLPELAFQKLALAKHGSLEGINAAYGTNLKSVEELRIPFREAFMYTFNNFEWTFVLHQITDNYYTALDNLVFRGKAVRNTIILIVLTMFLTLTVNPLAAYALSRFRMPQTDKIILFFIGTMAFPAAVGAIPSFLLLRDLGLLNTFAALVLPTVANGMSIFLLKGFFDSLPQELYEAATIDGASELQIFRIIALPLIKPILAVSALNAFIAAYNGWEWAIIVAQDRDMWTLSVWTYQFAQLFSSEPSTVMAAFLLTSLPVFIVFIFCQKIIMKGIILPQMK